MLTDAKIKTLKPKDKIYRILDSDRLYIEVRPTGKKIWRFKYTLNKKEGTISFGEYPSISLADARKLREKAKEQLAKDLNPSEEKKKEKQLKHTVSKNTFRAVAEEFIAKKLANRSEGYVKQFQACLERDVYKYIGSKNVKDITSADILYITTMTMKRIQEQSPHTTGESAALQNQTHIGSVIRYAITTLRAEYDPTYAVRGSISKPDTKHARALSKKEIVYFRDGLKRYTGFATVKNAGAMLLYSMLRSIEVRRMKWEYVNFEEKTITFPREVMKKKRIHIVPITHQIMEILLEQQQIIKPSGYIFPGVFQDGMLSVTTLNRMLLYVGMKDVTTHDFRATASTYLNEKGYSAEWIEKQLAHADDNKIRASYNHAQYLDDRRKMLQDWADMVDGW